jgi:hypothetical protein
VSETELLLLAWGPWALGVVLLLGFLLWAVWPELSAARERLEGQRVDLFALLDEPHPADIPDDLKGTA